MIDFAATEAHFLDHLAPTWRALPETRRGQFFTNTQLVERATAQGITPTIDKPGAGSMIVVASYGDLKKSRAGGRRVVLSEHGAGQSYMGVNTGSYIGAPDRAGCVGVLVPGKEAAQRHEHAHPTIPAFPVGCPRLDDWHTKKRRRPGGTVAISFHWNCNVTQETKSAYRYFERSLALLTNAFDVVLGHGHPRMLKRIRNRYKLAGIEIVDDFTDVLARADVYVVDNSSTLFEFASTGRPVAVLNAPWYRRHMQHGMRFWEYADIGVQIDHPAQLVSGIQNALDDTPARAARRAEITDAVYAIHDGTAASGAASAVLELAERWDT